MAKKKKPTQLQLDYKKQVKRLKQAVRRAEKRGYIMPDNIIPVQSKRITRKSVERLKKITTKDIYAKSEKLDIETGELISGEVARKQERSEAAKKSAKTRKSVERLKKITTKDIYAKSKKLDIETGEVARKQGRSEAAKKSAKTRKEKRYNAEKDESEYYEPQYETFPSAADIVINNFRADLARFPEVAQPLVNQWLNSLLNDYSKEDVAEMLEEAAANGLGIDYTIAYREDLLLDRLSEMLDLLPGASTGNKMEIMEALEYEEDWELPD